MQAGSLNCPECGAAVTSDSPQCPYCQALLQTVACTHCMGMMFAGSKFCPHCGAAVQAVAVGTRSGAKCPHCRQGLVRVRLGNVGAEECPGCGGLLIPAAAFDQVCSDAASQSLGSGLDLLRARPMARRDPGATGAPGMAPASPLSAPGPSSVRQPMYLPCPVCGQPMSRVNYAHAAGVITNICRDHGVWLEHDQLSQIVEFIRTGGLDRARRIEQERLDSARRALESERAMGQGNLGGLVDLDNDDDEDDSPLSLL